MLPVPAVLPMSVLALSVLALSVLPMSVLPVRVFVLPAVLALVQPAAALVAVLAVTRLLVTVFVCHATTVAPSCASGI